DPDDPVAGIPVEEPVDRAPLAASDVDDDVVRRHGHAGEQKGEVLVVGVAYVVGAEMRVLRTDRAAQWFPVPEVANGVAGHLGRPADDRRELQARNRTAPRRHRALTLSVRPVSSSTRRAPRAGARTSVRVALSRRPRNVGAKTIVLRSSRLSLENCCL